MKQGFTLIELLVVVAILGIIAYFAIGYFGSYETKTSLDSIAAEISSYLQQARSKSMAQEKGEAWGVEFTRSGNDDFYQIYSTGGDTELKIYLPSTIRFVDSTVGKKIQFAKLYGTISAQTTIGIYSQKTANSKTITVNKEGRIYID